MAPPAQIWLVSYPRSGNTFLRTVLWQCFGLRSASIYPNDLEGNKTLEEYVGHIEHDSDKKISFSKGVLPIVKTHEKCSDNIPAIYVIRDGRAASLSLWKFYNKRAPLEVFIDGKTVFGSWADHVKSWDPWSRPNTLLLRYEDIRDNLPIVLGSISNFLERDIIKDSIPDRETIASTSGRFVNSKHSWLSDYSNANLKRFDALQGDILEKAGYPSADSLIKFNKSLDYEMPLI